MNRRSAIRLSLHRRRGGGAPPVAARLLDHVSQFMCEQPASRARLRRVPARIENDVVADGKRDRVYAPCRRRVLPLDTK